MKKIILLAFVLIVLSTATVVRFVRPVADSLLVHNIESGRVIAQANSTTTVYLDPSTINGTEIGVGNTVTVNLNISDAVNIRGWQAGLIFNATALECTGFFEGEFLLGAAGPQGTDWISATINNTAGLIVAHGCALRGDYKASGSGRLAYLTFEVKASGVSDLHFRDVMVVDFEVNEVPINIIDIYTVVADTTAHTVVTMSNSTGQEIDYGSGFYDHAFSLPAEKISFKVTGPHPGFSNVTIPKTLLNVSTLDEWRIVIDGILLSTEERTVTYNGTHYSLYFTYNAGIHYVQITTRALISSTISITLSSSSIAEGSGTTINGDIDPMRLSVIVTILYRYNVFFEVFRQWTTLATVITDSNSHYSYTWTPEKAGTYEVMGIWEGDDNTFGNVSDVQTLAVLPIHVFEVPWDDEVFHVVIKSNSTVSTFNFNQSLAQISFKVTGQEGTNGFCNITIPKTLMWVDAFDEWDVAINGTSLSTQEITVTFNSTHYSIYFTCRTSTVTIQVISKYVIPEFPTWTSILLTLIVLTVAIAIYKRRRLKTPIH